MISTIRKIFERDVRENFLNFFFGFKVMGNQQNGFIPGRSLFWNSFIKQGKLCSADFHHKQKAVSEAITTPK